MPHGVNLDFLKQSWVTQAVKWVHLSIKGKRWQQLRKQNSRHPSQSLAPEWECTRAPLGDEKCFPWTIHHHHTHGDGSPTQGTVLLGVRRSPALYGQLLVMDGPGLCASPAWLSSMAGRRGGQGEVWAEPPSHCESSCLSLFHWELPAGRTSSLASSLVPTSSQVYTWLSVNACWTSGRV